MTLVSRASSPHLAPQSLIATQAGTGRDVTCLTRSGSSLSEAVILIITPGPPRLGGYETLRTVESTFFSVSRDLGRCLSCASAGAPLGAGIPPPRAPSARALRVTHAPTGSHSGTHTPHWSPPPSD